MNVAHIFNELQFSGAEVMLSAAAEHLLPNNDMLIIGTAERIGAYSSVLTNSGYSVHHIPNRSLIGFFISLRRFARDKNVDILHIHTEQNSLYYTILARICNLKVVRTIHNEFLFEGILRVRRILTRNLAAFLGAKHVSCSRSVQQNERARFWLKSELIDNWIDPRRINTPNKDHACKLRQDLAVPSDSLVSVSIANEAPAKNLTALFNGLIMAQEHGLKIVHFHCGQISPQLRALADNASKGTINLLGTVSNIAPILATANLFLSTSFNEGGQISLLEAAAAGLHCITTKVGVASAFEGREAVTFIEPTAAALCDALLSKGGMNCDALSEPSNELSTWTRQYFDPSRGAKEYLTLYASLLNT